MPIHFSIGFVVEPSPRRQFESVCGFVYDVQEISTKWVRSGMCCDKVGCCGECISRELLCIGSGNDKRFLFSVLDSNGDEVDISNVSEILFTVSDGVMISGNLYAGGEVRIEKRLSLGDIIIVGTGYQFIVDITPFDADVLVKSNNYWDATVFTSGGAAYTIKAGVFRVTPTNAGI